MTPSQLQLESFRGYTPEARALAERHLALLRVLPLSFVPLLLREVIGYDRKFPAERLELEHQFEYLASLSEQGRDKELAPFRGLKTDGELQKLNWVDQPARFSEALSAHLWSTHQIDGFHAAAVDYMARASAAFPAPTPAKPRVAIMVVGQGAAQPKSPIFRKLRPHGVYFTNVDPQSGLPTITSWLDARAAQVPDRYAHWSISGGGLIGGEAKDITTVSYQALAAPRALMSSVMRQSFEGGMGSEALRTRLAAMQPADLGMDTSTDPAASWFRLSLLSEGSGTQIYSTSFVQWAAREALRRAQPVTMVCRYTPRVRSGDMKDLLSVQSAAAPVLDPDGSFMDAEMGAYQTWLNFQRLPGADKSVFICWFEGHRQMVVIGPGFAPGTIDASATTFAKATQNSTIG